MGGIIDCITEEFQLNSNQEEEDDQPETNGMDVSFEPPVNKMNLTTYGQERKNRLDPDIQHYFDNMVHTDKVNQTFDLKREINI